MADDGMKKNACLNPAHADRAAQVRGLCDTCYTMALNLIKDNKTTWEALIKKGRALEAKGIRRGGKVGAVKDWMLGE